MTKVKLCSINNNMTDAWKEEFKDYSEVDIIKGSILNQEADAIVSPGNSFGLMDAGLDKIVNDFFYFDLEKELQEKIKTEYYGELVVGNAAIIKTNDKKFPYFISSPTMRVPTKLSKSTNVYRATRAVLISINEYNKNHDKKIKSVIIPGMGVGSGRMPYETAAKQMKMAYEAIVHGKINFPKDWEQAIEFHKELRS